ncbi:DUF4116 domain-containing protein [Cocleimonas sp. KMM 6892]|uniref:DUF4116 domain-containing protein n=1 Tax=unclassified Cocleimonas TaxID=2639732 RepID=UPI002DB57C5E|nr:MULTISPECIES: DUF4116 domain-containing protein [unclassified Cocleimonas]MEB8433864.1 DUF4116 domain-containing protein [Cocleimonas sp. KMM 6892]MEC4716675.1 DUF4116 domain-containing protein [Cocleimonas sp. KMM 6895]MEC4746170.1 DUF4116 domain-containing protein [Cocleimonas sp. KMM 6896]
MILERIKLFLFTRTIRKRPTSDEEWEICRKAYSEHYPDIEIDLLKEIDSSLGSKTLINNEIFSPIAWFYNIRDMTKNEKVDLIEDHLSNLVEEDEDEKQMNKAYDLLVKTRKEKILKYKDLSKKETLLGLLEDGMDLEYVDPHLKKDLDIVMTAVMQNGIALDDADESLKSNKDIVMAAVKQNGEALSCADDSLKDDREIVIEAVNKNCSAMQYASDTLKKDREIALIATLMFAKSGEACYSFNECIDKKFKSDRAFVLEVVSIDGGALCCVDEHLRKDKEVVLTAVRNNGHSFMDAHISLQADREFVLKVVKEDGSALQFASDELKKDKEIILIAIEKYSHFISYADESMKNDEDILRAIELKG